MILDDFNQFLPLSARFCFARVTLLKLRKDDSTEKSCLKIIYLASNCNPFIEMFLFIQNHVTWTGLSLWWIQECHLCYDMKSFQCCFVETKYNKNPLATIQDLRSTECQAIIRRKQKIILEWTVHWLANLLSSQEQVWARMYIKGGHNDGSMIISVNRATSKYLSWRRYPQLRLKLIWSGSFIKTACRLEIQF